MKPTTLAFATSLALAATAPAANVVWVSFHGADDAPTTDAANAGFTNAPDIGYTQLLSGAGHTVNRFVTKDNPTPADLLILNAADLVIIGRSVNSGNYQDAVLETPFWNTQVTKPVIVTGGYLLRNNRLNFTSGTDMPDTSMPTVLNVTNTAHPIFSGISFTGNTMDNTYADVVTSLDVTNAALQLQRGISVNNNAIVGGTVLATGATADATVGGTFIAEWETGDVLGNGNVLGGPRLVLLTGSREADGLTSQGSGIFDLTADGQQIFLNAVDYMAIPEPSALLLSLAGGWLFLVRRRR